MRGLLLGLLILTVGSQVFAGPASERVFSTSALDTVSDGATLVYDHVREGTAGSGYRPVANGEIRIELASDADGNREAAVTMGKSGALRAVNAFPASSGNPLVPIFLESALRTMAHATGGSDFYIRNRIKEALGNRGRIEGVELTVMGATIAATHIVFEPFTDDKNRDRMGAFADLQLHFYVSDAVPGDVIRFLATTGDDAGEVAYREIITFQGITEVK